MPPTMSTAMAPVADTVSHYQPEQVAHNPMQQQSQANTVALDDSYADESYDYGQYGEYDDGSGMIDPNTGMPMQGAGADGNKGSADDQIRECYIRTEMGEFQCLVCDKQSRTQQDIYRHVEAKHVNTGGYICPECSKYCPTMNSFRNHKFRHHRNINPLS